MAPMKFFRTSRRAVALIAAYALALQPLVATLAWATHASSLVPGQPIVCQGALVGGSDHRGAPMGSDRVCGCCVPACCGTAVGVVNLPSSVTVPAPRVARLLIVAAGFVAVLQALPTERYYSRAPPIA